MPQNENQTPQTKTWYELLNMAYELPPYIATQATPEYLEGKTPPVKPNEV
jgi:hypothetical protein